ncbi:MAG TPA: hypothetical protein VIA06_00360 [Candidatus Dormibacteraeota bacterium]|nr:hypothetical protein [Candidatus Dormibacteraeota bacterium]
MRVPVSLLDLLASACFQMQFGASIRLRTIRDQLTLEEAADLLGIDRLVLTNGISSGDLHPTLVDAPELASGDVLTLLRRERGGALVDLKELLPPDIEDA